MTYSPRGEFMFTLLLVCSIQFSFSSHITEDGIVSIKAKSIGCDKDHETASIMVNQKEYSNQLDGIHIVTISPNSTVNYKSFHLMRKCKSGNLQCLVRKTVFKDFFLKLENGTVAIVTTQNICSSQLYNLLPLLKSLKNLQTGMMNFKIHYHTLILIGCYGYCPSRVFSGTIPYSRFSTVDQIVKLQYSFKDHHPFITLLPSPSYSSKDEKKSINHTRSYMVAFTFFPLIVVLTCIAHVLIRHRRRTPDNPPAQRGSIQSDTPSTQYTGLDSKRPSAFPNAYELWRKVSIQRGSIQSDTPSGQYTGLDSQRSSAIPSVYEFLRRKISLPRGSIQSETPSGQYTGLNSTRPSALPNYESLQKLNVEYEEVESPSHFLKNEVNVYLYLLPDHEEENKYYLPTNEGDVPNAEIRHAKGAATIPTMNLLREILLKKDVLQKRNVESKEATK